MTARKAGTDADTWRMRSRATLPSPGRSKLLRSTGLLNGQSDRSPRLPPVFMPSSPGKSAIPHSILFVAGMGAAAYCLTHAYCCRAAGSLRSAYFSIPRWEQDAYSLKEEAAVRERKKHAANIKQGSFVPPSGSKSWVTRKIDLSASPRAPRIYDPWMQ
jgi:hypothetical protein